MGRERKCGEEGYRQCDYFYGEGAHENRAEHDSDPRRALELDGEQRSQKPDRNRNSPANELPCNLQ